MPNCLLCGLKTRIFWNGYCNICCDLIENEGSLSEEEERHLEKLRQKSSTGNEGVQ